ncbi:kinase-like protein [Calocera viscosa TUFC12733]|uniref:Kinase-like protein n=1 Tax=Calocera viscosa (strain TUFC12733) TaxID=1330018 RepID=A0A167IAQ5_CALVF|nr:kinase-like protein [Calocera viscosa TUFC12733]
MQLATREAWTWSKLHHENIVPFTGIADLRSIAEGGLTQLCLVSPWMDAGHITFYVNNNTGVKRMRLLWDVVKGVEYLHANQVTHGDLKGNNVLVDMSSGFPRARLTDFGASYAKESWSETMNFASSSKAHWGNVRWMAFERISSQDLRGPDANSQQSDVFEMMRTFLEVLTGKPPFQEVIESRITHYVMEGHNPKRPQGRIDGLDDSMWRLMMHCWAQDRNRRPKLSNIYDEVEARVLSEALSSHDTAYLEAIDATTSAINRFVSHASPITRAMLLEGLCYTLLHTPQALYEHEEFERLLSSVIESLAPLSGDTPDPNNAGLYKASFAFLGTFARFAATIDPTAWILATQGRLSLSTLVSGILGAAYLDPEDFQDILSMVLQDMESSAESRSPAALDDALIRMSRLMVGATNGNSSHLEDYWRELLKREFVQDQLLLRIHAEEESQVDWASIFSTIVSWLHEKSPTDPECEELMATLLGKVALRKFLGHSSKEHEVDANLEAVALVLQLRNGFRPINQDDLETILPILCRYLEMRSEFDMVEPCMRLLAVTDFREGLAVLIMTKSPPIPSTLVSKSWCCEFMG